MPVTSHARVVVIALVAAVAVAAIAFAQQGGEEPVPPPAGTTGVRASTLPAPDAPIPRGDAALGAALTDTTLRLRAAVTTWARSSAVPPDTVTLLALFQQRIYRRLAEDPARADRVVAALPVTVHGEARDIVLARRALAAIPRGPATKLPRLRTTAAAPAAELRAAYTAAERRFGVPRDVLAAVNFVESAFGRVRSASEAGARGPMQFLPATWRAYGLGGDIDDPADAILGAANYLRRSGAPGDLRRALFAYNRSTSYVSAILRFARRMERDERTFDAFYAWQVYARTPAGTRRLTGP